MLKRIMLFSGFHLLIFILIMLILSATKIFRTKTVAFKKNVLSEVFVSEGVAVADVNKDGKTDVLAGAWWWEAPGWKKHELAIPDTFTYDKGYSTTFLNFALDVNLDGWIDLIRMDQPGQEMVWYENPKNKEQHWTMRMILPTAGNEAPQFVDVDGDGRKDVLCNDNEKKEVVWYRAPVKKGDTLWTRYVISNDPNIGTHKYTHGLGYGDLNKDGRKDVIINTGWWEGPADPKSSSHWKFHPAKLGPNCADMIVYDVDGDKDMDVFASSAHDYGIWWYEQVNDGTSSNFISHLIDSSVSQTHSLILKDINGDGHPDLTTGKRYFAHNGGDRGAYDASMLNWYEFKPGRQPSWIRHEIDNNSGVGIQFNVEDINKDKLQDIIISNKKGVFVFEQVRQE
ncbi:VCBS repeat-containing protein [Pollutibacter soli]|uniref:FG-GAP repeat domain-containing protein n=1 Tax=Pollutibacter soli TaxID=3034157 RepID=UPI0030134912